MSKVLKIILISIASVVVTTTAVVCGVIFGDTSIKKIALDTDGARLVFDITEDFSAEGLVVRGKKTVGDYEALDDYVVDSSSFVKGQLGTYTIKVSYKELETSYDVSIRDKGTLTITKNATFAVGQPFKNNSPELTHTDSQGQTSIVSDYEVLDFDPINEGEHIAKISAFGFEYNVECDVVDNYTYFTNILNNVLLLTTQDKIKSVYFNFTPQDNTIYLEENGSIYGQDITYAFEYRAEYFREDWLLSDGTYIVNYYINGQNQTSQYDSIEEVDRALLGDGHPYSNPYQEYMDIVNIAQQGLALGVVDKITTIKDEKIVHMTIVASMEVDETLHEYRYEVDYDTEMEIMTKVEYYQDNFRSNYWIFITQKIPPIPSL